MALDRNGIIEQGERVRTPRFMLVTIKEIMSEPAARLAGYGEPTHFRHPEYDIRGRRIGENRMEFAAVVLGTDNARTPHTNFSKMSHDINAAADPYALCACADAVHDLRTDGLLTAPQSVMLHHQIKNERVERWPVIEARVVADNGYNPDGDGPGERRHYVLLQFEMSATSHPIRLFDAQRFFDRDDDSFRLIEVAPAVVRGAPSFECGWLVRMHMESGIIKEWDAASLFINSVELFSTPCAGMMEVACQ